MSDTGFGSTNAVGYPLALAFSLMERRIGVLGRQVSRGVCEILSQDIILTLLEAPLGLINHSSLLIVSINSALRKPQGPSGEGREGGKDRPILLT